MDDRTDRELLDDLDSALLDEDGVTAELADAGLIEFVRPPLTERARTVARAILERLETRGVTP